MEHHQEMTESTAPSPAASQPEKPSNKSQSPPSAEIGGSNQRTAQMYLVISNISKRTNVRALFLTATAFGCKGVFVVGQKSLDIDPDGADIPLPIKDYLKEGKMSVMRFAKWIDFVDFIRAQDIRLIGVEIHSEAKPVDAYLQDNVDTAFLMGNEGQGLSEKQMESCNGFVRIPQYGNGTASLNVYVASSIILQRFNQWQLGL